MADTPTPQSAAAPAQSSADAALFAKYIDQHSAAVAAEIEGKDADAQNPARAVDGATRLGRVAPAAADAPAHAARVRTRDPDARADGPDGRRGAGTADDAGAAADNGAGAEAGRANGEAAAEAAKEAPAALTEADAIALARKAHAAGDTAELDRALRAILPGSKGLSEFAIDGKRYGEFRVITNKERKKLDARSAELDGREQNLKRGQQIIEQLVARYEPIEKLLQAAQGDDPEAFVTLVEKATNKPLNDTVKRALDKKLGKPVDPEVDALRRELKAERDAREARERQEQEARQRQEREQAIGRHLAFLDQELGKNADPRIAALGKSREGLAAVFRAQQRHYDAASDRTISPEQAARLVIEEAQKKLEPWQRVLGSAPAPPPPSNVGEKSDTAPRATPLGVAGGAGASGGGARKLSDAELFEKYERIAKLAGD